MKAIDLIKEHYVTEDELAQLMNITPDRIRDLRSHHITGKQKFIDHIKPSGKQRLYPIKLVFEYLENCPVSSFGSAVD